MRATLQSLRLSNYRSFRDESVELDNPTFLVGQNGAGKSNFADAVAFLSEAMAMPLSAVFRRRGGFERVVHRRGKGRSTKIGFHLKLRKLDKRICWASYDLVLRNRRDHPLEVMHERCIVEEYDGSQTTFDREASPSRETPRWLGDVDQPRLRPSTLALPLMGDWHFALVFEFLANMRTYCIDPLMLRAAHEPHDTVELHDDGSNAAGVLRQIRRESLGDWEDICELLAAAVPGLASVKTSKRNGELALDFFMDLRDGSVRFDASQMSDGTLRALGILVAAYQNPPPSLMVIEEPEASIHPSALGVILDVLRDARNTSQIVVTTHSPDILEAKWIKHRHLRLVSWDEGRTHIDPMSPSVRQAMEEQLFGAGELLRSNALDGMEYAAEVKRQHPGRARIDVTPCLGRHGGTRAPTVRLGTAKRGLGV